MTGYCRTLQVRRIQLKIELKAAFSRLRARAQLLSATCKAVCKLTGRNPCSRNGGNVTATTTTTTKNDDDNNDNNSNNDYDDDSNNNDDDDDDDSAEEGDFQRCC